LDRRLVINYTDKWVVLIHGLPPGEPRLITPTLGLTNL
jgi:hypothetical protein